MIISINGKGMEVSEYLEDVVRKRVSKLDKYLREDAEVHVMLSMFRGRQAAEITVPVGTTIVRAEEATGDMYASIDNATKKIERQIIRYRTRMDKRIKEQSIRYDMPILPASPGSRKIGMPSCRSLGKSCPPLRRWESCWTPLVSLRI